MKNKKGKNRNRVTTTSLVYYFEENSCLPNETVLERVDKTIKVLKEQHGGIPVIAIPTGGRASVEVLTVNRYVAPVNDIPMDIQFECDMPEGIVCKCNAVTPTTEEPDKNVQCACDDDSGVQSLASALGLSPDDPSFGVAEAIDQAFRGRLK